MNSHQASDDGHGKTKRKLDSNGNKTVTFR